MISFEDAVKIAKETRPEFHVYEEYKEFYVFSKGGDEENGMISFGGYDMPIIVMKSTGKVMGYSEVAVKTPERLYPEEFISEGTY